MSERPEDPFGRGYDPPVSPSESFGSPAPAADWQSRPPDHAPPPGPQQTNSKAITALVLGILGVVLCPLVISIPAIIVGNQARAEINQTGAGGAGLATAGIVLGWIGVGLAALGILVLLGTIAVST